MYHGIAVSLLDAITKPYSDEDYSRFKQWGLNSVLYEAWWSYIFEQNELSPNVYNENTLTSFEEQTFIAMKYGLKPILSARVCYNLADPKKWHGWSAYLGADYVNLNKPDASGTGGRDRFSSFLTMIASRFQKLVICPWHFPYHNQIATEEEWKILHETTLPILYESIRKVTSMPIIINPIYQGQTGDWETGLTTGFYGKEAELYGWPFTNDPNLIYGFNNHGKKDNYDVCTNCQPWNYNYIHLEENYKPLNYFKNKYDVNFCCVESLSLNCHSTCSIRPIDPSRLDWAKAQMQIMKKENLGWFYWMYENPPKFSSPIETDGSDNEIASILMEYAPTPIFPWNTLLKIIGPIGIGLYFIKRISRRG